MSERAGPPVDVQHLAPTERGWGKLILALAAFLLVPTIPQVRAMVPIEQTMFLFIPALAACCLVGWWAGGRFVLALAGIIIAVAVVGTPAPQVASFYNLARGWGLLLAGSFGLVCLFSARRPLFARALLALTVASLLALVMSALGPVTASHAQQTVAAELARRNAETLATLNGFVADHPEQWKQLTTTLPQISSLPAETEKQLLSLSNAGLAVFPGLLALESLLTLALAWATYHRLSRARLGAPLAPLREFRFNDQLVWGLIVGLTVVFLPTLGTFRGVGGDLLVFFGALYALRGLGVLAWFLTPGRLTAMVTVGFAMLWWPFLNVMAVVGFMLLGVTAFGLGLGDTWADWRHRLRSTT